MAIDPNKFEMPMEGDEMEDEMLDEESLDMEMEDVEEDMENPLADFTTDELQEKLDRRMAEEG